MARDDRHQHRLFDTDDVLGWIACQIRIQQGIALNEEFFFGLVLGEFDSVFFFSLMPGMTELFSNLVSVGGTAILEALVVVGESFVD